MMNAQKIFEQLMMDFVKAGIPLKVDQIYPVLQYSRALTKLGSCTKTGSAGQGNERYTITLSVHAMKDAQQIRNTLAHELVHTLPRCMNHGKTFQRYGELVEARLGIEVNTRATKTEAKESGITDAYRAHANYKLVCQGCGNEIYRQKMSPVIRQIVQTPDKVRCTKCGSTFKAYKITRR